jgi:hypothetical protein
MVQTQPEGTHVALEFGRIQRMEVVSEAFPVRTRWRSAQVGRNFSKRYDALRKILLRYKSELRE